MIDKNKSVKVCKWCWIVQNETDTEQHRQIGLVLENDRLGDVWIVTKNGDEFKVGQYSMKELIPLSSCTGWDYLP